MSTSGPNGAVASNDWHHVELVAGSQAVSEGLGPRRLRVLDGHDDARPFALALAPASTAGPSSCSTIEVVEVGGIAEGS